MEPDAHFLFHAITEACNTKCVYCRSPVLPEIHFPELKRPFADTLDWPDQKQVIDNYATIRPNVNVAGGEPLNLRAHHPVSALHQPGQEPGLQPHVNGLLLEDAAADLVDTGIVALYLTWTG